MRLRQIGEAEVMAQECKEDEALFQKLFSNRAAVGITSNLEIRV
jgi:hypothetical protein